MKAEYFKDGIDKRDQWTYPLEETLFHQFIIGSLQIAFRNIMEMKIVGHKNIPQYGAAIIAAFLYGQS